MEENQIDEEVVLKEGPITSAIISEPLELSDGVQFGAQTDE